ncbi:unnamed protein product [Ectocarpus sp. CCAP 1310/34]|nr:unnamed protein product [Ectocarpus sp. CCAP 1310/34]
MFRVPSRGGSRDPLLPHSGNGRSGGGGLYGRARSSPKAALSKSFIATMVWALLSMSMIFGGWVYCSRKMESTWVLCEPGGCKIEDLRAGETTVLMIPRHKMVRGELVRVKNGEVVDPVKLRRSAQRKLGHSYNVVYLEPDSEDDDDESYDSFEDDDDSYDSYDGDDDSSEEDDDEDDYDMAVMAQRAKERLENAIPPAGGPSGAKAAMASFPNRYAAEARREAELVRKDAQRAKWAKDREERGLPPIKEPDEQQRQKATAARGGDFDDEERFPGDAATMREKNRREIRNMEEARGMTAEEHRELSQQAFEEAAKAHKEMQRRDQQMRQMGNNLHYRAKPQPDTDNNNKKLSPDDPDNNPPAAGRPPLERGQAQKDLDVNEGRAGGGGAAASEDELRKGGGRSISSVGGLEEFDNRERRRLSPSPPDQEKGEEEEEEEEDDQGLDEGGRLDGFGDVVQHVGAAGSRRKLLSRKNPVKQVVPKPSKPTKEELAEDASKSRETHRQGHGHHQKRARKVAQPTGPEERADGSLDGEPRPKTKHHHKAFHHKEDVPQADRHHVHPGFHHRPGDKKIEHGWRHQHRQWHHREELKKLGTPFSLGRTVARKRKEAIDNYVSRRVSTLDFTDSKKWRAGGLWLIIVGCMSIAFCIVIGNFQPRPLKKMS